jgi:hypothetical protein
LRRASPVAHGIRELAHPPQHVVTSAITSRPSTEYPASAGARSAGWSTARRSVELTGSPRNIPAARSRSALAVTTASAAAITCSSTRFFE